MIFISITLTETEKGKGPPLEFVGIPNVVKKELGLLYFSMLGMVLFEVVKLGILSSSSSSSIERNAPLHHTWSGSSYLAKRKMELEFDKHFHRPVRQLIL